MAAPLPEPIQFGKYTLFERIGRGGMADVFKGRIQGPEGFERIFVVKRVLPHLCDDPTFNKMFVEEAKLSALLHHANIVQVFELGSVEGEYFIAMEYVKGRDFAEAMREHWTQVGPPRPELVAYVGREICRALAYAHSLRDDRGNPLGMIHRDVSPSNIMLSYEGAVKLLDFGIARALGDPKKRKGDEGTRAGTLKGKFAYMAPEQTLGDNFDHRIDIFATGIVLHEALTGCRLFKGANDLDTIERVRQCIVMPPSAENPYCPPELDAVILRALAAKPEDRFQSAAEMADHLDDVVHATRFQPEHLAHALRQLFPHEAGPVPDRTRTGGSASVSPRPRRTTTRSASIPPITLSPARPPNIDLAALASPPRPPLWRRPAFLGGALALVGVGIGFGVWQSGLLRVPSMVSGAPPGVELVPASHAPADGMIQVSVQSIPAGASVFLEGDPKSMGETPLTFSVPWNRSIPTRFILRKGGYAPHVEEILPSKNHTIIAGLKPAPAATGTVAPGEQLSGAASSGSGRSSSAEGSAASSASGGTVSGRSGVSGSSGTPSSSSSRNGERDDSGSSSAGSGRRTGEPAREGRRPANPGNSDLIDPF